MVEALLVSAAGTIFLTVLGGTLLYIIFMILGLGRFIPAGWIYGLIFVGSLVALPPYLYEVKKKAYQRTVYNFYDEYLDFQQFKFYLTLRRGRIRYKDVGDIVQQASTLQDQRRLTSLYLYVPSLGYGRGAFAGLEIADLPAAGNFAHKVMDIVEHSQKAPVAITQPAHA